MLAAHLLDDKSGKYYIHLFNGFVVATNCPGHGPWQRKCPRARTSCARACKAEGRRSYDNRRISFRSKARAEVIVTTSPTELI